jgi:GNAT superfamily N-acetyltransferase
MRSTETWSAAHFFLQNDDGEIVGGALGNIWGDWYFLDVLWVDRPLRGQDNGQQLLAAAEQYAIERACTRAHLDTASFQARPQSRCSEGRSSTAEKQRKARRYPTPRRIEIH